MCRLRYPEMKPTAWKTKNRGNVHLVIADLFLPKDFAAEVCADLRLPALEKLLARGRGTSLPPVSFEDSLNELFGIEPQADVSIAAISAAFDGLGGGCWLRADPVHLRLQREQLVLLPDVAVGTGEAAQICESLNDYFAGQGMVFFAPHPQRWYVRLEEMPDIETASLSQASGRDVRGLLPSGKAALHWHRVFNEIQMLLYSHPANEAREARGELPVNSVWLWGGGQGNTALQKKYDSVSSDEVMVEMFAAAAGMTFDGWQAKWRGAGDGGELLVWTGLRSALQRGDLATWREAVLTFETGYAQPLWQALRSGEIARLQVDILDGECLRRVHLSRGDTLAFWRSAKALAEYSVV